MENNKLTVHSYKDKYLLKGKKTIYHKLISKILKGRWNSRSSIGEGWLVDKPKSEIDSFVDIFNQCKDINEFKLVHSNMVNNLTNNINEYYNTNIEKLIKNETQYVTHSKNNKEIIEENNKLHPDKTPQNTNIIRENELQEDEIDENNVSNELQDEIDENNVSNELQDEIDENNVSNELQEDEIDENNVSNELQEDEIDENNYNELQEDEIDENNVSNELQEKIYIPVEDYRQTKTKIPSYVEHLRSNYIISNEVLLAKRIRKLQREMIERSLLNKF